MSRTYLVRRSIDAPIELVWSILTDGESYPEWNPSVIRLDGRIADGEQIELLAEVSPKRAFKLSVSTPQLPTAGSGSATMIWNDAMPLGLFKGTRTFTLESVEGGTSFEMGEVFGGLLAPIITRVIPDLSEAFDQFADGLKQAAESTGRAEG